MGNADVVPPTGITIFKGEERHIVWRATAQPGAGRKMLVVLLKIRMLADWCHGRLFRRHIVHGEVPFFDRIITAPTTSVATQKWLKDIRLKESARPSAARNRAPSPGLISPISVTGTLAALAAARKPSAFAGGTVHTIS